MEWKLAFAFYKKVSTLISQAVYLKCNPKLSTFITTYQEEIFQIKNEKQFEKLSLQAFEYQYINNKVYQKYVNLLNISPKTIKEISEIPFLPIELFKTHAVITGNEPIKLSFESSGTTGTIPSVHHLTHPDIYEKSFVKGFEQFYGKTTDYVILALLPSYIERNNSSLVYMFDRLIKSTQDVRSGFYLNNMHELVTHLASIKHDHKKVLLLGVSYALWDLADQFEPDLSKVIVMETGGMKGKKKELTREELYDILTNKLNVTSIHSEYGMTELLSQAYSKDKGIFTPVPWMKALIRNTNDPFEIKKQGSGGLNIIDLSNIHSCCFIETKDIGELIDNKRFKVLGRFDDSDVRGCNQLVV